MRTILVLAIIFCVTFCGCTHGLEPAPAPEVQPGFGGTVYFSNWPHPPADSVYDIRIVAFYKYPPLNIINEVLTGQAKIYPPIGGAALPLFVDSLSYIFDLDSSSTFQYVVIAMQYGSNTFVDWKVVGAYGYLNGVGSPEGVVVPENTFANGINIYVNFKNPPPTPGNSSFAAFSK